MLSETCALDLSRLLRAADPAAASLTPSELLTKRQLLRSVIAAEPDAGSPATALQSSTGPRRVALRRPVRLLLASIATTAVVCTAAALALSGFGSSATPVASFALPAHGALSSWTPSTTRPMVTDSDTAACASALQFTSTAQPVVLTSERRGDFTSLTLSQGADSGYCILAGGSVENWLDFADLTSHPLADANTATISVMQGSEWMYAVTGLAGQNVTQVSVHNPDTGAEVAAAVEHGVWSAWWPLTPDSRVFRDGYDFTQEVSITFVTIDGASRVSREVSESGSTQAQPPDAPQPLPILGTLSGWSSSASGTASSRADVDACVTALPGGADGTATAQLAESRGSFTTLLVDKNDDLSLCVLENGRVRWTSSVDGARQSIDPTEAALTTMGTIDDVDPVPGSLTQSVSSAPR